tara:strand:+ start:64 stop:276 length:213 start_codon:yes stop_codon:yes gene_type:complete
MCFAAVFGMTCVYMTMMIKSTLNSFDNAPRGTIHPEMENVKSGERLLVFKSDSDFDNDEEDDDDGIMIVR